MLLADPWSSDKGNQISSDEPRWLDLGSVSEEIDHLVKAYLLALYTGQERNKYD